MVGSAVGFYTRAFVTFGAPIDVSGWDHHSRRDVLELAHVVRDRIGRLQKVLPTSLVAAGMKPSTTTRDLTARVGALIATLDERGANLDERDPNRAVEAGLAQLVSRGAIVPEDGRHRVRDRTLLRYYARALDHLLPPPRSTGLHAH
jgi:hypothetical protein